MDKMIKEIVETDKASRLDVEKAMERREKLTAQLAENKKATDEQYSKDADSKISAARQEAKNELEKIKADIKETTDARAKVLESTYDEKHSSWEKTIVSAVTGG